jgi:hypothetical protein
MPSTFVPRCQCPSAGVGGRYSGLLPAGTWRNHVPVTGTRVAGSASTTVYVKVGDSSAATSREISS